MACFKIIPNIPSLFDRRSSERIGSASHTQLRACTVSATKIRNPSLISTSSTTTAPPARTCGHARRNSNSMFSVVCRLSWMNRVNRPGGVQQSWQPSAARSSDQGPIGAKRVRHGNADFLVEFRQQQRRHVDTPQTPAAIAPQPSSVKELLLASMPDGPKWVEQRAWRLQMAFLIHRWCRMSSRFRMRFQSVAVPRVALK